ncbi:unnamed protein product [Sphenostylis stenocarpa]|uniref:RING-type E3 ubiquitin transferase n=1 Tax=Sphenostylis stenocarpa TaxID=92480 RepID=A0AA86TRP9_9FABA|nr:unnamed protein product [Sphenostylis stenocarpa]
MNPSYPSSDLSSTLSSLKNLIALSNHVLSVTPSPPTLNANLIQCPFNPHHLIHPHSLFLHHLRCPSSPRPLPDLTHSLTYPQTLHNSPSDQLSFYLHSLSNFFYRDCPAVVSFSHADSLTRTATLTLPAFLSIECADTDTHSNLERLSHHAPILPSQYFSIARELQSWHDFPTTFSNFVRRAILGLGIANDRDLMDWIIANSPRYGVVVDTSMQQHMFLLCCPCLMSIIREASVSMENKNSHVSCPVSNQALTWLAYQVSILYGAANGKAFVLNFVKKCITVGASVLLLFPLGNEAASMHESHNLDTGSGNIKVAKSAAPGGEKKNCILDRKISVCQVAAAVAALHERSLLEQKIKGFWQQPSNYQLVAEHSYLSEKANEERTKRPDYRPIIDHDGIHRPQLSNQESSREKTREELLAEERDYKRRRMSYRGKKTNQSPLQVMRYMIEDFMEQIKQAEGFESPLKMSEESGLFPFKPPGHDISMEANNSRKASHDSPAVTTSKPHYCEQQSHSNCCDESKNLDGAFSRDYKQLKHERQRSHYYREDQWNADRGKYHRNRSSTSPVRHSSHSQSREHSSHHIKQDYYSNRKKHDNSSRFRDRLQNDTHGSHISDSFPNKTFSDRYDPSESLDICDDDISSDAKYIKSDKDWLGQNRDDTTSVVASIEDKERKSCSAMATTAENEVSALKQKLQDLVKSIVDNDDYPVQAANEAIHALSTLKDLKCIAALSTNLDDKRFPSHFRCPLSNRLMTDPVILTTEQTFDRPFIQKWLDQVHGMCPMTHQVLSHAILTPNFSLQSMISNWCKMSGVDIPKSIFDIHDEQVTEAHRHRLLSLLVKLSLSVSEQKEAAKELRQLAEQMSGIRSLFGNSQMIELLTRPLSSGTASVDTDLQEDLIATLLNLTINDVNKRVFVENENVLTVLIDSLKSGTVETRSNAAAAFSSLSSLASNKPIIGKSGAIKYLVDLLEEGDPLAMKDAGSALFKLCFSRENIARTVREGAVQVILNKIVDHVLVDELLSLLALLGTHAKAVEELVSHGGVRFLLDILRENTGERTKENIAILLDLICHKYQEKREEIKEEEMAHGTFSELAQNGSPWAKRKASSILYCLGIHDPSTFQYTQVL